MLDCFMSGIEIVDVQIYHPETIRNNDYYLDKFENKENLNDIFKKVGRKTRFVISNENENSLTMALEASKKYLKIIT